MQTNGFPVLITIKDGGVEKWEGVHFKLIGDFGDTIGKFTFKTS